MTKSKRSPSTRTKPVSKPRSPAMKSGLKSKAKASSSRGPGRAAKRQAPLQDLLEAIRATPADDELRLVYADALEEVGELERAELVRAHLGTDRQRASALQLERDEVLSRQATRWRSDRGLSWHVEARIDDWLAHGAELFETEPITSIAVLDPRREVADEDSDFVDLVVQLAKQPWLAYVHALEIPIYSTLGEPDVVVELLGSPHLRRMAQLQVGAPLTAIAAARHCAMPALAALVVCCEGSSEGDDALRAYAKRRDALTRLELLGCGTGAAGMATIAEAGWKLERLVTGGTVYQPDDIGAAGIRAIAGAPALASLRELAIESGGIDDAAVRALAESPHLRSLHELSLCGNPGVTDDGIAVLVSSPVLATIRVLNLAETAVTERGLAMLPGHVAVIAPQA